MERYNRTLFMHIRNNILDKQVEWDLYFQPLTYAYNARGHGLKGTSLLSLTLTRHDR